MGASEVPTRDLAFLSGGGEMGERMRRHDWTATPLGLPETWPQSLRSMLSTCLNSPMLGTILWGPDLRMLYNDAYIPSMAERHPAALGRPVADVWGSSWNHVSAPFYHCMQTGEGFSQQRVELPMVRRGRRETTYWNFSAAPIRGEDGSIVGLLNQGAEITEQVVAERRLSEEAERLRKLFGQAPSFTAILNGPEHVFHLRQRCLPPPRRSARPYWMYGPRCPARDCRTRLLRITRRCFRNGRAPHCGGCTDPTATLGHGARGTLRGLRLRAYQ